MLAYQGVRWLVPPSPLLEGFSFSQTVYDDQGRLLRITLSSDEKYRIFTPLEEISPLLIQAALLQEDQYFFIHPGVNPASLIKAAWQTYIIRSRPIGASTITMQLARIIDRIPTRKGSGKLQQILKALELELRYSKQQILEAYLNLVSYGGNIEGVGAASAIYFNKLPKDINLPEALELSVIPQNPLRRSHQAANIDRISAAKKKLFKRWTTIHPKDLILYKDLLDLPFQLTKKNLPFHAPHFVNAVLRQTGQLKVLTTLNLELQKTVEKITQQYLQKHCEQGLCNAAVMLVDARNLEIKALMGSGNYFSDSIHGQINGTLAKRSPGSAIKPFIYALAMDQGLIHPCTVLYDIPSNYAGYAPENFEHDFLGPIKAKDALVLSRNIPALSLTHQLKAPSLYQFLQQASVSRLRPEESYGLSIALGSAELTMHELAGLYAMLLNRGIWHPLRAKIDDAHSQGVSLLSQEASFLTLDMLRSTPYPYKPQEQVPVYWKTGTSSGYRDAWSVGIFGPYVLAVWLGDFDNKAHTAFIGAKSAAPLFFSLIDAISKEIGSLPDLVTPAPDMNLTKVMVCEASGALPNPHCPNLASTWFIPGKSPIAKDTLHREVADKNLQTSVQACRPPDILQIYSETGLPHRMPLQGSYEISCLECYEGEAPRIISPKQDVVYALRRPKKENTILFSAAAGADVNTLYWFLNETFIGKTSRSQPLAWQASSGKFSVRVIDDRGRSTSQQLVVEAVAP